MKSDKEILKEEKRLEKLYLKNKPLFDACEKGDLDKVKELITNGLLIHVWNKKWETPLITACIAGHLEIVKYLLDSGANVKFKDSDDTTALTHAGENGHLEIVKYLIERFDIDVNAMDSSTYDDYDVYNDCYIDEDDDTVYEDDEEGYSNEDENYGITHLRWRVDTPILKYLISKGMDVNIVDGELTQLSCACQAGDLDLVKYLIEIGADVNLKCEYGISPLYDACENEQIEVIKYLLQHGADVFEKDDDGKLIYENPKFEKDVRRVLDNHIKTIHRKEVISKLLN